MCYTILGDTMNRRKLISAVILIFIFLILINIEKEFKYTVTTQLENSSNYKIEIFSPKFNNKKINKKIKDFIENEKKIFFENINGLEEMNMVFELFIDYNIINSGDILNIHLESYLYTGGSHGIKNDIILTYDYKKNKFLDHNYLFEKNYLEKLSELTLSKIKSNSNYHFFDEQLLDDGIKPVIENFDLIIFNKETFTIIFPQYQIAPWSEGVISLEFSYDELGNSIKKKNFENYFNIKQSTPEEININQNEKKDQPNNNKLVALTFDDGPNPVTTKRLLDELKQRNIKATFFLLGRRVELYPEITRKIMDEKHTLGIHTYSHRNLIKLTDSEIKKEIDKTNSLIYEATGTKAKFFRPPYGSFNTNVQRIANMPIILWDIDTMDWKNKDKNKIANEIIKGVEKNNIVLAHDLYESSVDGVIIAIDKLINNGYQFVSLEEYQIITGLNLNNKEYYSLPK